MGARTTAVFSRLSLSAAALCAACGSDTQQPGSVNACLPTDAPEEVFIDAGAFTLGNDAQYPEERPTREVEVAAFWIDATEVTNAEFAEFVEATGYVTAAERGFDRDAMPGFPDDFYQPGSIVFTPPTSANPVANLSWWKFTPGANWRHPLGPDSSIEGKDNYPVVQVTIEDAKAYAAWAGRRIPTEVEWERAAKFGTPAPASAQTPPDANHWQGLFPYKDTGDDGYQGAAPVGCFPPSKSGLYDIVGNVWELTTSVYYPTHAPGPQAQSAPTGYDPANPGAPVQVIKGGSFLCARNFCQRYRPSARQSQDAMMATSHIGFRTVRDGDEHQS